MTMFSLFENSTACRVRRGLVGLVMVATALLAARKTVVSTLSAVAGGLMVFSSLTDADPLAATKGGRLVKKLLGGMRGGLLGKMREAIPGQGHLAMNREQQALPKSEGFRSSKEKNGQNGNKNGAEALTTREMTTIG